MSRRVGALVLAAGFSNRFGSIKLCAELDNGATVFAQTHQRISEAIAETVVVSRPELATLLAPACDTLHIFDTAEKGMGATLAYGVSLISDWDACLVCLADMPFIASATYGGLAALADREHIILPTFEDRVGNPVTFGQRFFADLQQLSGDSGGRPVVRQHAGAIIRKPVSDPAILYDIDTPDDLARLQKLSG